MLSCCAVVAGANSRVTAGRLDAVEEKELERPELVGSKVDGANPHAFTSTQELAAHNRYKGVEASVHVAEMKHREWRR